MRSRFRGGSAKIEALHAQARGQATQIRMRALKDAAELVQKGVGGGEAAGDAAGKLLEALDGRGGGAG